MWFALLVGVATTVRADKSSEEPVINMVPPSSAITFEQLVTKVYDLSDQLSVLQGKFTALSPEKNVHSDTKRHTNDKLHSNVRLSANDEIRHAPAPASPSLPLTVSSTLP